MKALKARILRFMAASVAVMGFVAPGVAGAHGNVIDTTGPNSENEIENRIDNDAEFDTENDVEVRNENRQFAYSGYADVRYNTRVGNVETGDAVNYNDTRATVNVRTHNSLPSNWGSGSGLGDNTIRYTGPNSENEIENNVRNNLEFDTENDIEIRNDNFQHADSGDATVHNNTRVGNVRTGDAVNENVTQFTVNVETVNN